jgi:hypothetical protein
MQDQGMEVLRFGGFEVENETQRVLERIDDALRRRCRRLNPSPPLPGTPGRGAGGEG